MVKTYTVAIDAGHGADYYINKGKSNEKKAHDPGAVAPGTNFTEEKFAGKVESYIKQFAAPFEKHGVDFVYTSEKIDSQGRYSSKRSALNDRKDYAKKEGADEFISLHFDSRSTEREGTRIHTYDSNDKRLANDIRKDLISANEAVIDDGLGGGNNMRVLFHRSEIPSVLIEFGDKTEDVLQNSQYQETVARALVLSSVERAIEKGVKVPEALLADLRSEYRSAQHLSIGSGNTMMASVSESESKAEAPIVVKEVKNVNKLPEEMTANEQLIAAKLAFPDLEIENVDPKGNIYSTEYPGMAIASFSTNKIWVGRNYRDDLSAGAETVQNPLLALKDNLEADITFTKIDPNGNVYAKGYEGAVLTILENGRAYVKAEYREDLSAGKAAVDSGIKVAARTEESEKAIDGKETTVKDVAANLQKSGAQYLADNSSQAQIPEVRAEIDAQTHQI